MSKSALNIYEKEMLEQSAKIEGLVVRDEMRHSYHTIVERMLARGFLIQTYKGNAYVEYGITDAGRAVLKEKKDGIHG